LALEERRDSDDGRRTMRTTARKAAVALAATALAIGTLAGCGDDSDSDGASSAPDNASKEDFCKTFGTFFTDIAEKAVSGDPSDAVEAIKDWAEEMEDVGLPSDAPDDVRDGFEVFLDAAQDLPDDATLEDLQGLGSDLSEADQDAGDAFGDWATETCPDAVPGVSDLPTDLPSDLESELPTDLPTDLDPSELESKLSELAESASS
jgi:hypothetical protein